MVARDGEFRPTECLDRVSSFGLMPLVAGTVGSYLLVTSVFSRPAFVFSLGACKVFLTWALQLWCDSLGSLPASLGFNELSPVWMVGTASPQPSLNGRPFTSWLPGSSTLEVPPIHTGFGMRPGIRGVPLHISWAPLFRDLLCRFQFHWAPQSLWSLSCSESCPWKVTSGRKMGRHGLHLTSPSSLGPETHSAGVQHVKADPRCILLSFYRFTVSGSKSFLSWTSQCAFICWVM